MPERKRQVPSASTNMRLGEPSPGMVTVVTVASRAGGRGRMAAEHAAIFLDLKRRWSLQGLKFLREKFAETKANKQMFGEVDSCCTEGDEGALDSCVPEVQVELALAPLSTGGKKEKW